MLAQGWRVVWFILQGIGAAILAVLTIAVSQILWFMPWLLYMKAVPLSVAMGLNAVLVGAAVAVAARLGILVLSWPRWTSLWASSVFLMVGGLVWAGFLTSTVKDNAPSGMRTLLVVSTACFVRGVIPLAVVAWPLMRYRTSMRSEPLPAAVGE